MAGWDNPNVMSGNKTPRIEEMAQVLQYPADEYVSMRLVGPLFSIVYFWFTIKTKEGKVVQIPKLCLDYDPIEQKFVRDICPYRASGKGRMSQVFYSNAIIRDIQENEPRKLPKHTSFEEKARRLIKNEDEKYFVKELNSKSYTPVRLVRIPASLAESISKMSKLNPHKVDGKKEHFNVAHPKYGRDISVLYNPNAKGGKMYEVQIGEATSIKKSERNYLMQPFFSKAIEPASLKEAEKDFTSLKKVLHNEDETNDDTEAKPKNNKNSKSHKDRDRSDKKRNDRDKDKRSSNKNSKKDRLEDKKKDKSKKSKKSKKNKSKVNWDDDIPF
jgi:hypothetical protein